MIFAGTLLSSASGAVFLRRDGSVDCKRCWYISSAGDAILLSSGVAL